MPPDYISLVDTQAHGRYDVTPLFADAHAFASLTSDLLTLAEPLGFDLVAGIDALGFILGAALALRAGAGFLPIRKGGKLPVPTDHTTFVDCTGNEKALEMRKDALRLGLRVLVVDEWIETGAQASASIQLIEGRGGIIAGIAAIHIDANERTRPLAERYRCVQVWPEAK